MECVAVISVCHVIGLDFVLSGDTWKLLKEAILQVLGSVTLEDMVRMQQAN